MVELSQEELLIINGGLNWGCMLAAAGLVASVGSMTIGFATILTPLGQAGLALGFIGYAASIKSVHDSC
ncbi:hypothetical protein GF406_07375 [candidate division KSB1 bacterium]|nr:hypothetical protein [candidate division KSB1 bacterium]